MLISNDEQALKRARFLATQARDPALHYQHSVMGYNYRMSNLLAGVGRAQLQVLSERVDAKRAIFEAYRSAFSCNQGIRFMPELANTRSNRWLTTLTIDQAETGIDIPHLIEVLSTHNIEARPVWKPLHLQPLFASAAYFPHEEGMSVSDQLFESGICLPSGSSMTAKDQQRVIDCIQDTLTVIV